MEIKMIGDKIAKARKEINISQAELAQRLFISPQAVGKWERGESIPDIITFDRLAKILGVDLNYFSEDFHSADSETAFKGYHDTIDNPEQKQKEDFSLSAGPERNLLVDFSGSNLLKSDFAEVIAPKRKFKGSALRGSSFAGADLTGSVFMGSDMRETNFDRTNLTDCTLSACNLKDASFNKTILIRTEFSASDLTHAKFTETEFIDVKVTTNELGKTVFENCSFKGVDFKSSDLRGLCLDNQTFIDVRFDKTSMNEVSFNGATLKNVSFRSAYVVTNKYYRAIKTISFDGTMMDKLTYASLKGLGADLSKVIVI